MEDESPQPIPPLDGQPETITLLTRYIQGHPLDSTAMLALADAIFEHRGTFSEALRIAQSVQKRAAAEVWEKENNMILRPYTCNEVCECLCEVNGQRTTRTLSLAEILDAARLARSHPRRWVWLSNHPVRHPLPSPFSRTQALVCCREDGEMRIYIERMSASRGTDIRDLILPHGSSSIDSEVNQWAENALASVLYGHEGSTRTTPTARRRLARRDVNFTLRNVPQE